MVVDDQCGPVLGLAVHGLHSALASVLNAYAGLAAAVRVGARVDGVVTDRKFYRDADGSDDITGQISYEGLAGDCTIGAWLQVNVSQREERYNRSKFERVTTTRTQNADIIFNVADEQFWADWAYFENALFGVQMKSAPVRFSNKKRQTVTVSADMKTTTTSDVPQNNEIFMAADIAYVDQLVDILNRIHWACLTQKR